MSKTAFTHRDRSWQPPALTPQYKTSIKRSPTHPLLSSPTTPSEETGPRFGHSMLGPLDNDLVLNYAKGEGLPIGERIIVEGHIYDENGHPVPNVLIEVWQANAGGRYRHKKDGYLAPLDENFGGCGRTVSALDGSYRFRTIKPGPYPWPNGVNDWRPSHIHFSLFGSGFAQRLISQMYFEGDPLIWKCPIVSTIPDKAGIEQLIAKLDMKASLPMDALVYRFDVILRGRRSTMFENRLEGN